MPEGDDLEARITAVEQRTAQAEGDAAAARYLAARCDKDVADMKETIRGFRRSLGALDRNLTDAKKQMAAGFAELRGEMQAGFTDVQGEMQAGFAGIAERLDRAIGQG